MKAHWEKFRQHGECCMVELDYCYIVCARSPVANGYETTDKPTFIVSRSVILRS